MQLYERIERTDLTSRVNNWVFFSRYLSRIVAMFSLVVEHVYCEEEPGRRSTVGGDVHDISQRVGSTQ